MLVTDEDYNAVLTLMANVELPDDVDVLLGSRPAWQREAACWDADPALFFPARGASVEPAKRLCASCTVAEQCSAYAEALDGPLQGIWGGVSERGRKRGERAVSGVPDTPQVSSLRTPARRKPPRPARPRPPSMFDLSPMGDTDTDEGPVDVLAHLAATGVLF